MGKMNSSFQQSPPQQHQQYSWGPHGAYPTQPGTGQPHSAMLYPQTPPRQPTLIELVAAQQEAIEDLKKRLVDERAKIHDLLALLGEMAAQQESKGKDNDMKFKDAEKAHEDLKSQVETLEAMMAEVRQTQD